MEEGRNTNTVLKGLDKDYGKELSGVILHDLLKLFAGYEGISHVYSKSNEASEKFLARFDIIIKDFILNHHLKNLFKKNIGENVDAIASSITREEEEDKYNDEIRFSKNPVFKFFNKQENRSIYYSPKSDKNELFIPIYGNWRSFIGKLKDKFKLIDKDVFNFNELFNNPNAALLFMKDYALNYPEDKISEDCKSLYVHSKLTAAFYSIYKLNKNGKTKFLLIDTAGMSKFLSNMYVQKSKNDSDADISPTNQFRSASFFIELTIYSLVSAILREYGLSTANIVYVGAGKALLILPHLEEKEEIVKEIIDTYNLFLNIFTLGSVFLVYEFSDQFEIKDLNRETFNVSLLIKNLHKQINKKKTKPYSDILDKLVELNNNDEIRRQIYNYSWSSFSIDNETFLTKLGKIIKKDLINLNKGISELFNKLFNQKFYKDFFGKKLKYLREYEFLILVYGFSELEMIKKDEELMEKIENNCYIYEIPKFNSLNLEETVLTSNRLGILKVDGNSFGRFFQVLSDKIEETDEFKWIDYSVISEYVDYVALKLVPFIFANGKTNIIYSAGDEFVIVGDWVELLNKYVKFLEEKNNILSDLSFSGALILVNKHMPLYEYYEILEEKLAEAKEILKKEIDFSKGNAGRDGLIFLDRIYDFKELKALIKTIKSLKEIYEKNENAEKHMSRIYVIYEILRNIRNKLENGIFELDLEALYYYNRLLRDLKEDERCEELFKYLLRINIEKIYEFSPTNREKLIRKIQEMMNEFALLILLFKEVEETSENNE